MASPGSPSDLGVVMGVHVDDAGCQHETVGLDRLPRALGHIAHPDNALAADGDIGLDQWIADAVGNHGAANYEIMHGPSRSFLKLRPPDALTRAARPAQGVFGTVTPIMQSRVTRSARRSRSQPSVPSGRSGTTM